MCHCESSAGDVKATQQQQTKNTPVNQMLEKRGVDYLSDNSPLVHRDLHNVTRTDAELKYVRECSSPPGAHNLHFYRVRKKKTDKVCNTWLAICARGVEVYEVGNISGVSAFMAQVTCKRWVMFLVCLLPQFRSPLVAFLVCLFSK